MIPNQWYAVLESAEVRVGRPIGVTRLGERLVFWRDQKGEVACLRDLCPHRGAALSGGKVTGDCVECPFHGFQFDHTGRCQLIPANGKASPVPRPFQVKGYPASDAFGFVWVWWGEASTHLPPLPMFDGLDGFSYAGFRDHWSVHYTRAIENQLDVVHLPFVHHNTIGRGNRTVIDGPPIEDDERGIQIWVQNRTDDGTTPRRGESLPPPLRPAFVVFRYPNLWQLQIAPDNRIFVAFAPVDECNTVLYVRYYQRFVKVPILRQLVDLIGARFSSVILAQDKRVVLAQRPPKVEVAKMDEKLIVGDRPITVYRARRRAFIEGSPVGSGAADA